MNTGIGLIASLLSSSALAEIPRRVVAATGDAVPAETSRPTIIAQLETPTLGKNGEVVFYMRSSRNQNYPEQIMLDLRADESQPVLERTFGPIFGELRDSPVGDATLEPVLYLPLHFSYTGDLFIQAQGTIQDGDAQTQALVLRRPSGELEIIGYTPTSMSSGTYDAMPTPLAINTAGTILLSTPEGMVFHGESPRLVTYAEQVPWEPVGARFTGLGLSALLEDDTIAMCCYRTGLVLWDDGVIADARGTPNVDTAVVQQVSPSGYSIASDYSDDESDRTRYLYQSRIGGASVEVSPVTVEGGCPNGDPLSLAPFAIDPDGRGLFRSTCGIGALSADGSIDWFVQQGDTEPYLGGAFLSFDAVEQPQVSPDGKTVLFTATASDPDGGTITGAWLRTPSQTDLEFIAYEGQIYEVRLDDFRTVQRILFDDAAVNDLEQATVLLTFADPEPDVRAPSAIVVINQQPITDNRADLEVSIGAPILEDIEELPMSFEEAQRLIDEMDINRYLTVPVTIENRGEATVFDLAATFTFPEAALILHELPSPACEETSPESVRCEYETVDPDGILSAGDSLTLEFVLLVQQRQEVFSYQATASSTVEDPDTSNNSVDLTHPLNAFDLELTVVEFVEDGLPGATVTITNLGNIPSPELELHSVSMPTFDTGPETCRANGIRCPVPGLNVGEQVSFTYLESEKDQVEYHYIIPLAGDLFRKNNELLGDIDATSPATINDRPTEPDGCATAGSGLHGFSALAGLLVALWRRRADGQAASPKVSNSAARVRDSSPRIR